jgi:hypothetical protein
MTMIFEAVLGDDYAMALASVIMVCRRWHVSTDRSSSSP